MNAFARSWEVTKLSFKVIKQDRELLLFPILSGFLSVAFLFAMLFPSVIPSFLSGNTGRILEYVIIGIAFFGLAVIATFFNVCTVYTAKKRFEGGNATFQESIRFAFSKIHLIVAWSLISATVGIILHVIDRIANRAGQQGRIILRILNGIFGMVWSIVTIFVVPAMVYYDLGPIEAIKKSVKTLRATWGESIIRWIGLGIVQFVCTLAGIIITLLFAFAVSGMGTPAVLAVIGLGIIYVVLVSLVFGIANMVYNTALFVYADTGRVPGSFTKDVVENAFRKAV